MGTADYAIAGGTGAQLFDASLGVSRWERVIVLARGRVMAEISGSEVTKERIGEQVYNSVTLRESTMEAAG